MITAIVFDCFGVLVSDGWLPFKARHFAGRPEAMAEATHLNRLVDAGQISYALFVQKVADLAGVPVAEAHQAIGQNAPDEALWNYIQADLKPHYRLGMLSNVGSSLVAQLLTSQQLELFDALALSYETGWIKPEPQAYEEIARRLRVPVAECVLVDDQPAYCKGAQAVGMAALQFKDLKTLQADLAGLLRL